MGGLRLPRDALPAALPADEDAIDTVQDQIELEDHRKPPSSTEKAITTPKTPETQNNQFRPRAGCDSQLILCYLD